MATATLASRPPFTAWRMEASQGDDDVCLWPLSNALEEIINVADTHHVNIPATWRDTGEDIHKTRDVLDDVADWVDEHDGIDPDDPPDADELSWDPLADVVAAAWGNILDTVRDCRRETCLCGYDWVELALEDTNADLTAMADEPAAADTSWWGLDDGPLRGDRLDIHTLLEHCHHGRGLTWFEVGVTEAGHITARCDGGSIELYALHGPRDRLARDLVDDQYVTIDEDLAKTFAELSDDAFRIVSTLIDDLTDVDEHKVLDACTAARLLADTFASR